jgi:RHS repeat-associated protein
MKRMLEGTTSLGATTNALRVCNFGKNAFAFDDFRVCSRSALFGNDASFAYNAANQLVSKTSAGLTTTFNYDPWGRLAERSLVLGAYTFTASYTYRFGDKLQRIDSTFPDEAPVILYNYDGLGKRRLKAVGDDTTYWRWDAAYSVLAEYHDQTPDWNIDGWDRFFVPFGQRLSTSGKAPYHEFTGKPWDEDAALYYFPYRYYSPSMNCWTSADPARLIDGPNVYGYVRGNPINKLDNWTQYRFR